MHSPTRRAIDRHSSQSPITSPHRDEECGFGDRLLLPRYRGDRGDLTALMLLYGVALACFLAVASGVAADMTPARPAPPPHQGLSLDATDRS